MWSRSKGKHAKGKHEKGNHEHQYVTLTKQTRDPGKQWNIITCSEEGCDYRNEYWTPTVGWCKEWECDSILCGNDAPHSPHRTHQLERIAEQQRIRADWDLRYGVEKAGPDPRTGLLATNCGMSRPRPPLR